MTGFALKIIAAVTMVIDHVGAYMLGGNAAFRIVGRLTFPIFAWFIAEGCRHTRSIDRYLLRLLLCAVISEPIFDLITAGLYWNTARQSILCTFLLAVLAIRFSRWDGSLPGLLPAVAFCAAAQLLHCDYGWYGVAVVLLFYLCGARLPLAAAGYLLLSVIKNWGMFLEWAQGGRWNMFFSWPHQIWGIFAFLPLLLYNGRRGPRSGLFFYIFYPAHLLLIHFLSQVIII